MNMLLYTWRYSYLCSVRTKIILHRIISVVWLTNFLSEIRSLSVHNDEAWLQVLSVMLSNGPWPLDIDDRIFRPWPECWTWSSLSGFFTARSELLFECFGKSASLQRPQKNRVSLNWCLSHTEIFSKRRKIYSVWVKDLSMHWWATQKWDLVFRL